MLLNELELYNNYKYNLEIYNKIDENKQKIMEFNNIELIKETINNLIHNEENYNKYNALILKYIYFLFCLYDIIIMIYISSLIFVFILIIFDNKNMIEDLFV
jgi:hypothetical protein